MDSASSIVGHTKGAWPYGGSTVYRGLSCMCILTPTGLYPSRARPYDCCNRPNMRLAPKAKIYIAHWVSRERRTPAKNVGPRIRERSLQGCPAIGPIMHSTMRQPSGTAISCAVCSFPGMLTRQRCPGLPSVLSTTALTELSNPV